MNKIIPILIIFLLVMSSFAFAVWEEIPKVITIQGKLTDATDDPVTDGNYDFEFDFTPNADGSSPPYIYTKEDFSVYNGIFSILVPIDTSKINFDQALYVQVKVKGPLDESYQTLKPTAQITSSGYAFTASAANDFNVRGTATVGGKTTLKSDLQVDGKTGLGINNPSEKLDVIGNIYVGGNGYVTISGDAIRSSAPFGFFGDDENPATDDWTAQIIHTGGILAVKSGEAYADYKTAIPNGGIYSRGNILTAGSISDPDSEVTINDDLKINTIDLSTTATNTLVNDGNVVKQRAPDSRVWGTTLTDGAGSSGYIAYWSDANS
ncbi:MAG: hypothetical protein KJ773_09850, partial [Candidatus Thermoplasmatota archaeon]|nr:hypothetical protein [Candidatus Thermoplasmatota archaeon]